MNKARTADIIVECVANSNLMLLTYKREKDNRQIVRTVEPYEVKEVEGFWYLYAYDTTGRRVKGESRTRRIKSFLLNNIVSVSSRDREFKPRY